MWEREDVNSNAIYRWDMAVSLTTDIVEEKELGKEIGCVWVEII